MALFGGNAIVAAILAAVVALAGYSYLQGAQSGAAGVAAKMEKQDNAAAQKISEAGKRSNSAAAGGVRKLVRDPNAVSE